MAHYVIYVPGLNDHRAHAQRRAIKLWRIFGVRSVFQPMHWNSGPFASKFKQLLERIDRYAQDGHTVSLVAASAGASVVLAAYQQRRQVIAGVVCICGKINRLDAVNPAYYRTNPAFQESLAALSKALPQLSAQDRTHVLSLHPLYDEIVAVRDTILAGAPKGTLPVVGHGIGIGYALTLGAWRMMRFLKRQG